MSFDSLLNKVCTIEEKTNTQDSYGQMIESWTPKTSGLKCRIDPKGGGKVTSPQAVYEKASHILFMRPLSYDVTTEEHRIQLNGSSYEIILVQEYFANTPLHHLEILLDLTS